MSACPSWGSQLLKLFLPNALALRITEPPKARLVTLIIRALTNSFGANAPRLKLHKAQRRVTELNQAAAELACEAARQHFEDTGRKAVVAGSMGPTVELFKPIGTLTHADTMAYFAEQANVLAEGGAEVIWIKTTSSLEEVAAAVEASRATGLTVCATLTFDTARRSMVGVTPADYHSLRQKLVWTQRVPTAGRGHETWTRLRA